MRSSLACLCILQHCSAYQRFSMEHWNGYISPEYQSIQYFDLLGCGLDCIALVQGVDYAMNDVYNLACISIFQHNSASQRFSMKHWNGYITSEYQSIQYFDLLGCGLDCTAPVQGVDYAMNDVYSLTCICIFQHTSAYQRFSIKHWSGYITYEYQSIHNFDQLGCGLDSTAPVQGVDYAMNDVYSLACICIFQHNSAYYGFSMKLRNGYISSEYYSIQYFDLLECGLHCTAPI